MIHYTLWCQGGHQLLKTQTLEALLACLKLSCDKTWQIDCDSTDTWQSWRFSYIHGRTKWRGYEGMPSGMNCQTNNWFHGSHGYVVQGYLFSDCSEKSDNLSSGYDWISITVPKLSSGNSPGRNFPKVFLCFLLRPAHPWFFVPLCWVFFTSVIKWGQKKLQNK